MKTRSALTFVGSHGQERKHAGLSGPPRRAQRMSLSRLPVLSPIRREAPQRRDEECPLQVGSSDLREEARIVLSRHETMNLNGRTPVTDNNTSGWTMISLKTTLCATATTAVSTASTGAVEAGSF
jgi:hypothetical protein